MEDPALASLSLTHISYDPTDHFSYICAWLSLVPQGLIVAYVTLSWATREAEILLCFAGQLACEACNFALKRLIREERPSTRFRGKGYGMPSSHAQFMAFFAVYVSLFLLVRHRPKRGTARLNGTTGTTVLDTIDRLVSSVLTTVEPPPYAQQALTAAAVLATAALVAVSRVYLNYHTAKQVLVGLGVGAAFALAWFALTGAIRRQGALDRVLGLRTVRFLRVRDLLSHQDVVQSGWLAFEAGREVGEVGEGEGEGEGVVKKGRKQGGEGKKAR